MNKMNKAKGNSSTRIKRKKTAAYVETEPEDLVNTTGICDSCYDSEGIETLLVPYMATYGLDIKYLKCPNCSKIISKEYVKHVSIKTPLGKIGTVSESKFEVIQHKRRVNRDTGNVFKVSDYPLAGNEDSDLRFFANAGIIVSVTDEQVDE